MNFIPRDPNIASVDDFAGATPAERFRNALAATVKTLFIPFDYYDSEGTQFDVPSTIHLMGDGRWPVFFNDTNPDTHVFNIEGQSDVFFERIEVNFLTGGQGNEGDLDPALFNRQGMGIRGNTGTGGARNNNNNRFLVYIHDVPRQGILANGTDNNLLLTGSRITNCGRADFVTVSRNGITQGVQFGPCGDDVAWNNISENNVVHGNQFNKMGALFSLPGVPKVDDLGGSTKIHGGHNSFVGNVYRDCYLPFKLQEDTSNQNAINTYSGASFNVFVGNITQGVTNNYNGTPGDVRANAGAIELNSGDMNKFVGEIYQTIDEDGYPRRCLRAFRTGYNEFHGCTFFGAPSQVSVSQNTRHILFDNCTFITCPGSAVWSNYYDGHACSISTNSYMERIQFNRCRFIDHMGCGFRVLNNSVIDYIEFDHCSEWSNMQIACVNAALTAGNTITSLPISTDNARQPGVRYRLFSGQEIWHCVWGTNGQVLRQAMTISSDVVPGDTSIPVNSVTLDNSTTVSNSWVALKKNAAADTQRNFVSLHSSATVNNILIQGMHPTLTAWNAHDGVGTVGNVLDYRSATPVP